MDLYLFNMKKDKRVVDKGIKNEDGKKYEDVIFKEGTSIINPTFIISGMTIEQIPHYNYVYYPKAARYYFINDIVMTTGKRVELNCSIDVLQSFRKDIKREGHNQFVARQENDYNTLLADSNVPIQSKKITDVVPVGENRLFTNTAGTATANDRFFVLQTMGAGGGD